MMALDSGPDGVGWARLIMIPGFHGLGVCELGTKGWKHLQG